MYGEKIHVANVLPPNDITTSDVTSQFVDLSKYHWAEFILSFGDITSDAAVVTMEGCTANSTSGGAVEGNLSFTYRASSAVGTDSYGAITSVDATSAAGLAITESDDNKTYLIDLDASAVGAAGYTYARVKVTTGGSMAACDVGATALLWPRYAQNSMISSS